jgi:hypothetical protein
VSGFLNLSVWQGLSQNEIVTLGREKHKTLRFYGRLSSEIEGWRKLFFGGLFAFVVCCGMVEGFLMPVRRWVDLAFGRRQSSRPMVSPG